MALNVTITPSSGVLTLLNGVSSVGSLYTDGTNTFLTALAGNKLRLGQFNNDVYIGDGNLSANLIFDKGGRLDAGSGQTLTIGQQSSSLLIDVPNYSFVTGGTSIGEWNSTTYATGYNQSLATLMGSTIGTYIIGYNQGSILIGLMGNQSSNMFAIGAYQSSTAPHIGSLPTNLVFSVSLNGSIAFGGYSYGILSSDYSGNITSSLNINIASGVFSSYVQAGNASSHSISQTFDINNNPAYASLTYGNSYFSGTMLIGNKVSITSGGFSVTGPITEAVNNAVYVYKNLFDYTSFANVTGTCKIVLPYTWTGAQIYIKVLTVDGSNAITEVNLSGTMTNGGPWTNCTVSTNGTFPSNSVRFGYDTTLGQCVILLGNTTTAWYIPKIYISDVLVTKYGLGGWSTGWGVSFVTSETWLASGAVSPTINLNVSVGATTVNATTLNGQPASFYTNFNNLINTPTGLASFLNALSWTGGTQVPVLTAAATYSLLTVGASSATNLIDRQTGDARYVLSSAESGVVNLQLQTMTSTPTLITTDGNTAISTNQIDLSTLQAGNCIAEITAKYVNGTTITSAAWRLEFSVSYSSSTLGALNISSKTRIYYSSSAHGWDCWPTVSSNLLSIYVLGASSTTINWTANVTITSV